MISQFFVLSPRGDTIISRDYRGDVSKGSAEVFFRKVKFWTGDQEEAPPVFNVEGVNFLNVKQGNLYFVASTRSNVSPAFVLELLQRIARITKDYCGILNEESLRKNFVLVYELLDEIIDFGYAQSTSTEALKSYTFNEPVQLEIQKMPSPASIFMNPTKRVPGTAVTKSVVATDASGKKREEVFVDIIERISVTFNASGYVHSSEIDGTIQMKSYLTGNPEIRVALNEDLAIGREFAGPGFSGAGGLGGMVVLDDCNFHESVRLDEFDTNRALNLVPPDGEFPIMNYRMTQEFAPPFRVYPHVEETSPFKAEVVVRLRAEFPANNTANSVVVRIPLPKSTQRVSCELQAGAAGQGTDFKEATKLLEWSCKKIAGKTEHTLRAKLTLTQERPVSLKKETGPINMTFTIPMYNASRLQVRYLQIVKKSRSYNPYRWVRYVTQASSYVTRL